MQSTFATKLAVIAAIPLMVALLSACSAGVEKSPSPDGSGGPKSSFTDSAEWQLAYAKCMRGEGIDMPDPSGQDLPGIPADSGDGDAVEKANAACISRIGTAPDSPGVEQKSSRELLAEQLVMAKCFRDAGFDVPDPSENTLMALPADVPADVLDKCVPSILGGDTPGSE